MTCEVNIDLAGPLRHIENIRRNPKDIRFHVLTIPFASQDRSATSAQIREVITSSLTAVPWVANVAAKNAPANRNTEGEVFCKGSQWDERKHNMCGANRRLETLLQNEACVNILMEQRGDVWVGCRLASWIPLRRSTDQCVSNDMLEATLNSFNPLSEI